MINETHNPDVLNCLANLSSDEVFTSPKIANEMLDMLPQELFENPNTTFLDPCTKWSVFKRNCKKIASWFGKTNPRFATKNKPHFYKTTLWDCNNSTYKFAFS